MVKSVNSMSSYSAMKMNNRTVTPQTSAINFQGDKKVSSDIKKEKDPNKIGYFRAVFSKLTDKQIQNVNETKKLTGKVKFKQFFGRYIIVPNILNITTGTKTLPEGFELKKSRFFGFTNVLPKDSEGFFVKKPKQPKLAEETK